MIIEPCPTGLEGIGVSGTERSPGVHVSDIYGDLFRRLEPDRYKDGPIDPNRSEAGLAFEAFVEWGLAKRHGAYRPGEVFSPEGIAMSPDLVIPNGVVRVGEIKYTTMSSNGAPTDPKFDRYFVQLKAYCWNLGTHYGRLIIFFANGDYSRPFTPQLLAWNVDFTEQELRDNWQMLVNHGKLMGVL